MYLDIHKEARTNGEFRHKLQKLVGEISLLERNAASDHKAEEKINQLTVDVYRHCNYNAGFLVPYFFPEYPFNKPLSLNSRPYSYCMFHFQIGGYLVVRASRQIGKALEDNEPILTPTGWMPIGYAQVGMEVYDGKGNRTKITNVFPQGYIEAYELCFELDGKTTTIVACGEHLWVGDFSIAEDEAKPVTIKTEVLRTYLRTYKEVHFEAPVLNGDVKAKIKSIMPIGYRRCTCITVESDEQTFVTRDYVVTHNSTTFGARQLINSHILPKYRSMYVAPHPSFLDTYANRVREMERAFRFFRLYPDFRQNLKYKEYPNGSIIYMVKCLTDSQEARSKTTDELLYDEYQLLDIELEADIEQTQKASRMKSTIYAGTSTTIESPLEVRYQNSSQAVWLVRAPGFESHSAGRGWINCGDEHDVLKCMAVKGFVNPATSELLNVRDGEWVHQNQRLLDAGFVGFHIPQVIIPEYVEKPMKWKEIIEQYQKYTTKKFMQEVLGIPTEEGQREITLSDLKSICDEELTMKSMREMAQAGKYSQIVSGCDWGGSDYNPAENTKASYTVHAILGIRPDKKIDILLMKQYSGMDYRDIINSICKDHKEYGATAIASDFGVGGAYNLLLRENDAILPERHLILAYAGPNTKPLSMPPKGWFNQYTLNRTDSITALYTAIKTGKLRCYNWAQASDRLLEFLNLYRIPAETAGGQQTFRYQRHGAKPDDSLHACNFAHVLTELIQNRNFIEDVGLRERLDKMLGSGGSNSDDDFLGGLGYGGIVSG